MLRTQLAYFEAFYAKAEKASSAAEEKKGYAKAAATDEKAKANTKAAAADEKAKAKATTAIEEKA